VPDDGEAAAAEHGLMLSRLALTLHRHRRRTVLAWIAALVAAIALSPLVAGDYEADFGSNGSGSAKATELLQTHFRDRSGDQVTVVWKADRARSPAIQQRVDAFLAEAQRLEGIASPQPPRVSRDGTIATTMLELDRRAWDVPVDTGRALIEKAEEAGGDGLTLAVGGNVIDNAEEGGSPEGFGLLAAAIVLLIAFGSIVAAGLPLAIALIGLGISASLITVLAAVVQVPEFTPAVAGLIGIGVGVDYALLVLTRFRTALAHGSDVQAATVEAVTTAGRSVLVAGTTVLISLLGLFLMNVSYLRGVALAASLAVLVVMAAAVTLLPALLSMAGPRVNKLRLPGLGGMLARPDRPTAAARWSRAVQRRPWTAAIAGGAVVIALTVPIMDLRLGFPDAGNAQEGSITRTAYDLVSEGFGPGANGPLTIAAELPEGRSDLAALERLADRARGDANVAFVSEPQPSPDGRAALLIVAPRSTPQAQSTEDLVHRLRDQIVPASLGSSGVQAYVGGTTAAVIDQSELVARRLPLFMAGVVGLSFLLLLFAFRSPLIAVKAGIMNLLSVGAAYGVISLFAQGGWAGQLLGIDTATPVAPFIPVMMFAILFGLSMDYEVFLLSRVREEYLKHGDTARAVSEGLAKTARVITAAAAIMVVVFMAFVTSSEVFLKLLGVGMATAILVDATIVRMVLVPAFMQLVGRANWWLPSWLDRVLPRVDPEPSRAA
jgi:putative drug exporter of the RND superfamily